MMGVMYIMREEMPANRRLYPARPAIGHMPFDHRSQAEVAEDEARKKIMRRLGR